MQVLVDMHDYAGTASCCCGVCDRSWSSIRSDFNALLNFVIVGCGLHTSAEVGHRQYTCCVHGQAVTASWAGEWKWIGFGGVRVIGTTAHISDL